MKQLNSDDVETLSYTKRYLCLYLFMLTLSSMYIIEQFTGWGSFGIKDSSTSSSFIYQYISILFVLFIFGWTIFAPVILSQRSFV